MTARPMAAHPVSIMPREYWREPRRRRIPVRLIGPPRGVICGCRGGWPSVSGPNGTPSREEKTPLSNTSRRRRAGRKRRPAGAAWSIRPRRTVTGVNYGAPHTVVGVRPPKPQAGRTEASSERSEPGAESAKQGSARSAAAPPRILTVRPPRLRPRPPKLALPFALVHAEPDPVSDSAARRERSARLRERAGRAFARLTVLPAIAVVAWLVPGLPLLVGGAFAPVPMLLIAAPLLTALAVNLLSKMPSEWPTHFPAQALELGLPGWLRTIGPAAIAPGPP